MNIDLEQLSWSVAEGHTQEYKFQNRFRHFPEEINKTSYSTRLNIFWNMEECYEDGSPTKEELSKLHTFEDRIIEAVESDCFSILSMVITGNGTREFVFHTPDPQEFINRLTNMPQEEDPYPLEIHSNEDEEWEYYYNEVEHLLEDNKA